MIIYWIIGNYRKLYLYIHNKHIPELVSIGIPMKPCKQRDSHGIDHLATGAGFCQSILLQYPAS
jgi:hypothetical protein